MKLKSIVTVYRGYTMRSRLEADVAALFDRVGMTWEYEREGYDLDGLWYLPDFWLPDCRTFVEVKPSIEAMTSVEHEKAARLAMACYAEYGEGRPVVIVTSEIHALRRGEPVHAYGVSPYAYRVLPSGGHEYSLATLSHCGISGVGSGEGCGLVFWSVPPEYTWCPRCGYGAWPMAATGEPANPWLPRD